MERQELRYVEAATAERASTLQFLSLYLLVLAFFILLVTISTFEEVKSQAVMDSLNTTFANARPAETDPTLFTSRAGQVLSSPQFLTDIQAVFTTAVEAARIEIVHPGRVMRIIMPLESLFFPGESRIRESQVALIDRVIASLNGRPRGVHYDMEFVVGTARTDNGEMPTAQGLPMTRAGVFVREMMSRGVPPDAISIGLRSVNPNEAVIWFYVRSENELQAIYRRFADGADQ
ncbi:MAG: flagellar motor protein MotB [Proteobacteria bacterium]|nr:flagellar motor protein MotB [Pseudomonadota bacterium]